MVVPPSDGFISIFPIKEQHNISSNIISSFTNNRVSLFNTFILFNDGNGIKLSDIKTNVEFYNIFKHICERLRSINNIPDIAGLENEVRGNRSKIKGCIKKETNGDIYAMEQFAIEGDSGDVNKVAGSTDDHRAYIKEMFGIKEP